MLLFIVFLIKITGKVVILIAANTVAIQHLPQWIPNGSPMIRF